MKSVLAALALSLISVSALAQNVRITPIGSHPGELCANDRATVFEDPSGVRILYDVAHNLTAPDDPRVGDVDVVLLSHMHGDHLGNLRLRAPISLGSSGRSATDRYSCTSYSTHRGEGATRLALGRCLLSRGLR